MSGQSPATVGIYFLEPSADSPTDIYEVAYFQVDNATGEITKALHAARVSRERGSEVILTDLFTRESEMITPPHELPESNLNDHANVFWSDYDECYMKCVIQCLAQCRKTPQRCWACGPACMFVCIDW